MRVAIVVSLFFSCGFAIAQDLSESEVLRQAVERQRRIKSIAAFKLHATVAEEFGSGAGSHYEVWMESRGDKVWAQMRQLAQADDKISKSMERVAELLGSDLKETLIFDGQRMIVHSPVKMQVTIEQAERFTGQDSLRTLFPRSWTTFSMAPDAGRSSLELILSDRLPEPTMKFTRSGDRLIVSSVSQAVDPVVKFRRLEIGAETGLIYVSEASGGVALPKVSNLEWAEADGVWYVFRGTLAIGTGGGGRNFKWEMHEFTTDPRQVQKPFTLDETELPLGTRIVTEPQERQQKRQIRYVGGEEGQHEHNLKRQAIRMIFERG